MNFYDKIAQDIREEAKDNNKYLELAKQAPTEKARRILTDIAHEESMHHKYLNEILSERVSTDEDEEDDDDSSGPLYEDNEIDYPTDIENVGVDEDIIEVTDKKK